jgi:hypothetical protein
MQDQLQAPEQNEQAEAEPVYAVIEVFGHRRLAGRIAEVEQYGTKLLRIDIPEKGKFENGFKSQLYGGASLFSVTHCDLATVERMNKPYEPMGRLTYQEPDMIDEEQEPDDDDQPY